jgi:hypothetical protein
MKITKKISDDLEKTTKKLDKHIAVLEVQNKYLIEMLQRHDRILLSASLASSTSKA